ncbi:Crp/Fnr family transcriptional regulator [Aliiroseovarius crassostreae]|uniref:Crp/Fnr family transcriptional regulator n=1 Tax=Aliiroseovarius crassostreae TaxID=154981 RepID=UPI0021FC502A|nr:Crp/Fnr family transcriptional regulator [Aliiroseovarius crassostreae]UWQ04515.1 Crp/Fnr family transcriptional regulator [Aliiroseovarius crassostreae]
MREKPTHTLASLPFFSQLSPHVRACLIKKSTIRSHKRGELIALQGDLNPTLKIVISGWVKLYRLTQSGEEATLAMLKHGESFDEVPALSSGAAFQSSEAITDCSVLHLDLSAICTCKNAFAELHLAVLQAAHDHAHDMIHHIEQLKGQTGAQRLSGFLLDLIGANDDGEELTLPFGKKVLASKLGMKPESLSRAFRQLKPFGVASQDRKVHLGNVAGLRNFFQECA